MLAARAGGAILQRGARVCCAFDAGGDSTSAAQHGLLPYALIWVNHIGVDRLLGYGLKFRTDSSGRI